MVWVCVCVQVWNFRTSLKRHTSTTDDNGENINSSNSSINNNNKTPHILSSRVNFFPLLSRAHEGKWKICSHLNLQQQKHTVFQVLQEKKNTFTAPHNMNKSKVAKRKIFRVQKKTVEKLYSPYLSRQTLITSCLLEFCERRKKTFKLKWNFDMQKFEYVFLIPAVCACVFTYFI